MRSVLVVEDDPAICELVSDVLRAEDFIVECVAKDTAAYARIPSFPTLHGLILDINLGQGTTGYDIARFARQVIPAIGVVYVSGEALPASFNAFGVPHSHFLQKPFRPDELVQRVKKALHGSEQ